tara:strand:+ start:317 stop:748 length:432 start_codon:yes stop_codon:yes gene_type:complete
MHDAYVSAFYDVVKETQHSTGYELPVELESYVVMLLANHIDKNNFLPKTSFAEYYLRLRDTDRYSQKELGDTCLFVRGVFPEKGKRYGIDKSYYSKIGKNCYANAGEFLHPELFGQLSLHFDFLGDFIELTVNPLDNRYSFPE